jgi:RadC-like JAB domain
VLDESRVAVGPFKLGELPRARSGEKWRCWLAHDFGSAAPSVTYLMAESPGAEFAGKFCPRGSILLLDELAAYRRDNLNMGLGWTAATTAEAIVEFCKTWKVRPEGCADDGVFARGGHSASSIADEFARCGVYFSPAKKGDRISGWQKMKRLLADAGKPDVPGLYVSRVRIFLGDRAVSPARSAAPGAAVYPREVVLSALTHRSAAVVCYHNHPLCCAAGVTTGSGATRFGPGWHR